MKSSAGLLALCAAGLVAGSAAAPLVHTSNGYVQGTTDNGVDVFHSIPFAAPPTGDRRFRAPAPVSSWSGTKDVAGLPPICPQLKLDGDLGLSEDEDCLYLHVYAPEGATNGEPLPVMFWIFGGGWALGDSWEFGWYDGANMARTRNVVVVAANYRVGPFGFMALDELQAEDPNNSTGNMGLLDQRAALQWTRDNVAAFGGNPDNVTIFGESAGGFSVCWHLASPGSAGLFAGAIMESGSCDSPQFFQSLPYAKGFGYTWAAATGCPDLHGDALLACLRGQDTQFLMKSVLDWFNPNWPFTSKSQAGEDARPDTAAHALALVDALAANITRSGIARAQAAGRSLSSAQHRRLAAQARSLATSAVLPALSPIMPWGAAVDGTQTALPDVPLTLFKAGTFNRVPTIFGTNANEGSIFAPLLPIVAHGAKFPPDTASLKLAITKLMNPYNATQVQQVIPAILSKYSVSKYNGDAWAQTSAILTDYFFRCGVRRSARAIVSAPQAPPLWLYLFDYKMDWLEYGLLGNYHTSELSFVWDNQWPPLLHAFSEADQEMSDAFTAYWTSLARNGTPNAPSAPLTWPQYAWSPNATALRGAAPDMDVNLNFHLPLSTSTGLDSSACDFWDAIVANLDIAE